MRRWYAVLGGNPWQAEPEPQQAEMVLLESGALVDRQWLRDEQARGAELERSIAAREKARLESAAIEAAEAERSRQEREAAERRELPEHLR